MFRGRRAGPTERATGPTVRHRFAAHLTEAGSGVRAVRERLGHAGVSTTVIDFNVLNRGGRGVRSPLDARPPQDPS